MKKTYVGITVVGKDREGAVAAFTNMVFDEGGNVEKISQNVVKGVMLTCLEIILIYIKNAFVPSITANIIKKHLQKF